MFYFVLCFYGCWGFGPGPWPWQRGQLGHGTLETMAAPTVIESLAAGGVVVVDASAGGFHSAFLTASGGEDILCPPNPLQLSPSFPPQLLGN